MIDDMEMLFNFEMNVITYFIKNSRETSFTYVCDERKIFIVNDSTGPGFDWHNTHFQNLIIDRFEYNIKKFSSGYFYKSRIIG